MKHLTTFCRHDVGTTSALTVGSPSVHRRGTTLKHIAVLVLILTFGVGQVWATSPDNYSFSSFTSAATVNLTTTDGFGITLAKNSGSNNPAWSSSQARVYAKGSLTISIPAESNYKITAITYTYVLNKGGKNNVTPTIDGVSGTGDAGSWNSSTKTWTASGTGATSVAFTTSGSAGNVGFTAVSITYTNSGGGGSSNPTLSSIAVSSTPSKTAYEAGDAFDVTGLVVTGTYSDASQAAITEGITWTACKTENGSYVALDNEAVALAANDEGIYVKATVNEITSAAFHITGFTVAAVTKSNLTFTAACGGSGTAKDGAVWTVTSDGAESNFDATSGIHYGTNNANVTYLQLTTSDISGNIKKVVVNARDAQATATISVTVGGTAFTCTGSATATNTSTDYTFTGLGEGEVIVRIDRGSSMAKAIYCKSIVVSYEPCTSLASINGSISKSENSVTITWDDVEGALNWDVKNGETSVGTISDGDTEGTKKCVINNLTSSTAYIFTVSADLTGYCTTTYSENFNVTTDASFTITATSNNENCQVSVDGAVITAIPATGYTYANPAYTVSTGEATVQQGEGEHINEFTVSPASNCTIQINFVQANYTVTMAQTPEASATLTGATAEAHYNGTINISTTVPAGYLFKNWTASSEVTFVDANATETSFTMPAEDVTITANFNKILTVSEALTAIAALSDNGEIENQYVSGVISQIDSYSSNYNSITYWISVDGTTTSQLKVYGGLAGVVKSAFASVDDLSVGADVTIFGKLKKYVKNSATTPEFDANSEIKIYKPKAQLAWSATSYTASMSGGNTFPNLTNTNNVSVTYGSANESVAKFTDNTDYTTLQLVAAGGPVDITASFAGDETYKANTISYALTVEAAVARGTITFNVDNGVAIDPIVDATQLPNSLPIPTKEGKNFVTWYTDAEKTVEAVPGTTITEDITLYAEWRAPYTVTEALAIIATYDENAGGTNDVYVAGKVSTAPSSNPNNNGQLTYFISVDGTTNDELKIYLGKGVNNASFAAKTDLQVDDQVVVYGKLYKYVNNSSVVTPEVNTPNYLYSLTRKELDHIAITTAPTTTEYTAKQTFDPAGMKITLYYNDESTEEVVYGEETAAAFAFSPALTAELNATHTAVTVTYGGKTDEQAITVNRIATSLQWSAATFAVNVGTENPSYPTLTTTPEGLIGVTYSSTDEDVALIEENTGEIVLGDEPGTATITASFAKTDVYAAAENATYTLTLNAANTPIFEVDPNSLDFEAVGLNQSKELTFTLSGSNLTADATLNIGGANAAMFSVSSSIAKDNNGDIITDVTVTYTPTVAGSHAATLTISSTGAQAVTVALVGEGKEIRTVAWQVNGAAYAPHQEDEDGKVNGSTEVLNGGKVAQLPTEPTPCEEGIAFVGWTTSTFAESDDAPQVLFKTIADAPEVNSNVIYHAVWAQGTPGAESWTETAITDLTESDVVVIVGNNGSNYAMSNANGTGSAPSATAVSVSGTQLTGKIADNLKWNISEGESSYTIYPNGSTTTWLYCTNANNGVRVGTNDSKTFVIDQGYLKHVGTSRYVGIYDSQDWRCYTGITGQSNIAGQTFKFYKQTVADPVYSAYSTTCTAPHDITKVSENGTMTVKVGTSEVTTAHTGNTVTVTIEAYEHYSLTGFAVNETNSETSVTYTVNDGIYSFTMPDADVTITATYTEETKYTITFNGGGAEGGTAPTIEAQYANTQNIQLPENTYVYDDNHIFNGWAVTSSEGPVAVNDKAFTMPAANVTITAKWALKQQCTLVLHVNGSQSEVGIEQGTAYDLTQIEDPDDVNGYTFYGWAESEETNDVETAIATISSFTPSATETTKNLYAVFTREEEGEGVTDVLTAADLTATGTTYTDFSNVSKTSSAIYAGNSSRNNDLNIQLRSKESNSGIVSTTSGGTIKSVTITVASGSNTIDVYGSNTSYASASDLYGDTKGTKIGSTSGTGTISPTEEQVYNYVGIRSNNGAVYLSSVSITWDNSKTYYTTLPAAVHDVTYVLGDDADWQTGVSHPIAKVKNNGTFTITEDVPVHASNKFSGWKVNGVTVSGTITITDNTNIVAQWTPKANSALTYSDGAETDPATSSAGSVLEGTEIELPAVGPEVGQINFSKAGFDFKGWKYNGKIYKAGSTFTMPAEPVTLVAQWKKVNTEKYSLVTSASQLLNGMKVVIAYNDNDQQNSQQYIAGNIAGTGNSKYLEAYNTDVTFSGQSLTFTNTNVKEWILMQSGNGWVLKNGEEYLGASTTSMTISTSEYVWNIFITPEGIATLEKDGYSIRYNYNNGSPRFKTYGSNSSVTTKPQLYAAMTVIDVTNISEVGNVDGDTVVVTSDVTIDVDIAPTTMIVPAGVTVTVSDQNKIDANTLIVEKGGKLDIATTGNVKADDNFVISTTLGAISTNPESGDINHSGASSEINNAYKIAASGNVFFEIELTQEDAASEGWYAFSVPFYVDAMSGVYYGNTQLVNEVGYAIMSYNGQKRANGEYGWAKYRGIMQPGVLYIITVADTDYKTLRFKKHGSDAFLQNFSIPVYQFAAGEGGESGVDNGWNGIGNPYMLKSYCTTSTYLQFLDHEANAFKQRLASAVNLVLGSAFFIQYGGTDGNIDLTIGEQTGDGVVSLAPTREGSVIENTIFEVKLRNSVTNKEEDNLFLTAREDATNTYEIGRDLAKMSMGTAKCAQIMVPAYGTNLCAADFPLVNNQAVYPLTMTTPTAGTYSLSAAAIEGADLYVTYEGAIVWNLSLGDYEMDLVRGTTTGYGLMLVVQPNQMPTGVENGELLNGENGVQKILLNGQLYILRDGHLYDAVGKEMK